MYLKKKKNNKDGIDVLAIFLFFGVKIITAPFSSI
jgi:hypothetical protein